MTLIEIAKKVVLTSCLVSFFAAPVFAQTSPEETTASASDPLAAPGEREPAREGARTPKPQQAPQGPQRSHAPQNPSDLQNYQSPEMIRRARPMNPWSVGLGAGFGVSPYGAYISSDWKTQVFESPTLRAELTREAWSIDHTWAWLFSFDGIYIRSVQKISSSRSTAELSGNYAVLGFTGGALVEPLSFHGFGFRVTLGFGASILDQTELRAQGFTTEVQPNESAIVLVPNPQAALSVYYRANPQLRLTLESRAAGSGHTYAAGVQYDL